MMSHSYSLVVRPKPHSFLRPTRCGIWVPEMRMTDTPECKRCLRGIARQNGGVTYGALMEPINLNYMTIMRHPHSPEDLFLGDKQRLNGYRFSRAEVFILAKLLKHIAHHEMLNWRRR